MNNKRRKKISDVIKNVNKYKTDMGKQNFGRSPGQSGQWN